MNTAVALPRWDMSTVYPGLDSPEFQRDFQSLIAEMEDLAALFDREGIGEQASIPVNNDTVASFDAVTGKLNSVLEHLRTVHVYIYAFITTDSTNDRAQATMSELQQHMVLLSKLETRYAAWIGSLDVEALEGRSHVARSHSFFLTKTKRRAQHLMSQDEESLAAELDPSGAIAWGKLHGNVTSQLLVRLDGEAQELPMSVVRNMAFDQDRNVRRRAYEAELRAWKGVSVPLAAAINSIKGQSNTLENRRSWESVLDMALFSNNIDRPTLDAMMDAATSSFPHFRRYLHAKARLLGLPALTWYDLFAPVVESEQAWDYVEATAFMLEQFEAYSERLQDFAGRAVRERWIDAEPRPGKRDGAFCVSLRREESRVLANYRPTYDGMSTLAHELGHAYHNFNLADRTPLQRYTPMTLAETASIFCETIVREAALDRAGAREQLAILEASLQGSCQIVVDITSRFLFEQALLQKRQVRELSVDELNELMLDSQRRTYGDGLDVNTLHPYMWAVKSHYYSAARPFYNFPYMFGLLFGLGLYGLYRGDPESFRSGYDQLLSSTGMADAATLAGTFGIDIRAADFWQSSVALIRGDIDRFEALADLPARQGQA